MNIGDRIKELELEIERLKKLKKIILFPPDRKLIKLMYDNYDFKYVEWNLCGEHYDLVFRNEKKDAMLIITIKSDYVSMVEDGKLYDIAEILSIDEMEDFDANEIYKKQKNKEEEE